MTVAQIDAAKAPVEKALFRAAASSSMPRKKHRLLQRNSQWLLTAPWAMHLGCD
jgi:hypothetical protein